MFNYRHPSPRREEGGLRAAGQVPCPDANHGQTTGKPRASHRVKMHTNVTVARLVYANWSLVAYMTVFTTVWKLYS